MTAVGNVRIEDQGVRWVVTYDWTNDQQTDPLQEFSAEFPRDFGEINPDQVTQAMVDLAMAVAVGKGVHD